MEYGCQGGIEETTKTADKTRRSIVEETFGQTGSSARQELTAWAFSLSLPIRSMYATDSGSKLSKAEHMIETVALLKKVAC